MAYLKTLTECTYALLYGYGLRVIQRFKRWEEEAGIDEDEFLFPAPTSLGNAVESKQKLKSKEQ